MMIFRKSITEWKRSIPNECCDLYINESHLNDSKIGMHRCEIKIGCLHILNWKHILNVALEILDQTVMEYIAC